jgi:two-component system cell cycle sensor histidine kinase/response regulator CckA
MHLLHLEDSASDAELIENLIRSEWPECQFQRVVKRADYQAALERGGFNLILSDYTLPGFDGLSALDLARGQRPDTPFIFLSGTIGEERAIEALKRGAADYVLKDRPNRIVAAIRRALAHRDEAEQRHRAEERVREQAALLDKARDAICVTDLKHRVTYWNASAERLFGWAAAEALGRDLRVVLFPQDAASYDEAGKKLFSAGEWHGELRPRPKNGATLIVESRWTLVADSSEAPKEILLINTDITEKKILETQFLRAQRMDSIGTLAGGIAHDLNNVLSPVLLAASMLRSKLSDPADRELVGSIEAGAEHSAALIKQLLAFARGADGSHATLRMHELIANLGQLLQPVLPRNLQLTIRCAGRLWPVRGDATQLNQVLMNLCINARDAMPNGGRIEIDASNVTVDEALARTFPGGKPGPCVLITVTDTGVGIPPEILDKIFDPFFTTKGLGKGTGLGLATVRGIVKGHGGGLQVESDVGRGTTFRLYLPAQIDPLQRPTGLPPLPAPRRSGEGILVIDDDRSVRNIFQLLLERAGYRVFLAADGFEGVAEFRRRRAEIDVVITDIMMPGMSGHDVIEALRAIDSGLRIIAISGMMEEHRLRVSCAPGAPIECVSKPIAAENLFGAIDRSVKAAG